MRNWATGEKSILQVIAEREAIYKMLAQTTPENIGKEFKRYSIDPSTRYYPLHAVAQCPYWKGFCTKKFDEKSHIREKKKERNKEGV